MTTTTEWSKTSSSAVSEEEAETSPPPSSPKSENGRRNSGETNRETRASFFSLVQVSTKLGEFWTSAKRAFIDEDYWIPSDPDEVALFPTDLLNAHVPVFPDGTESGAVFRVCQGSMRNNPGSAIYHVTFDTTDIQSLHIQTLSIHRSGDMQEAIDLCQRCRDCQDLFTMLDVTKDLKRPIRDLISKLRLHPLWKSVHIAVICGILEFFVDSNSHLKASMNTICHPEHKYPLMLAIENNQIVILRRMLELGVETGVSDINGNNAMHYASLISVQMLEVLWSFSGTHSLLNIPNHDGCTPLFVAVRNANPRCTKTLLSFGAELHIRAAGKSPLFEAMTTKNKSVEVLKALLDASPQLLFERETLTGNTVLHAAHYKPPLMALLSLRYKPPLMALLSLRALELNLNERNSAGQTALHIFAHRGDLGLVMTLASYACDLDAQEQSSGNTALHIAVSKRNLDLTRLLLSLGADPNIGNNHNDTSRHLAARLNLQGVDLLKSLEICGAMRCPENKVGCASGCANEAVIGQFGKKQSSLSTNASSNSSPLISPRRPAETLTIPTVLSINPTIDAIRYYPQKVCYENMMKRLDECDRAKNSPDSICLLSLDGGGIRGLVIIQILLGLEVVMGEPIFPYFDWVAGTSTGALIAAALTEGKSLRQCQQIYLRFKDIVFDGWARPYNSMVLESFMQRELGQETTMADLPWPRLLMSTVRADCFPVQLEFMRNYRLPLSDEDNEALGYGKPQDLLIWKALRRTSAAPTYFSCVDQRYIDGGIIANNPACDLLQAVYEWNACNQQLSDSYQHLNVGAMVSVGTGIIPRIPLNAATLELSSNPYASAVAIKNLGIILVDQVTATEGAPVTRSRAWCHSMGIPFVRLSAPIHKDIAMDTKDDRDLARMMWDCVEYSASIRDELQRLAILLKRLGHADRRRFLFRHIDRRTRDMPTQTTPV